MSHPRPDHHQYLLPPHLPPCTSDSGPVSCRYGGSPGSRCLGNGPTVGLGHYLARPHRTTHSTRHTPHSTHTCTQHTPYTEHIPHSPYTPYPTHSTHTHPTPYMSHTVHTVHPHTTHHSAHTPHTHTTHHTCMRQTTQYIPHTYRTHSTVNALHTPHSACIPHCTQYPSYTYTVHTYTVHTAHPIRPPHPAEDSPKPRGTDTHSPTPQEEGGVPRTSPGTTGSKRILLPPQTGTSSNSLRTTLGTLRDEHQD